MAPFLFVAALFAAAAPAPPRPAINTPPPEPQAPLSTTAEDRAAAAAMAAQLTALDARIAADETRMTQLREVSLAQGNAAMRAIKPVMPLRGDLVR